MARELRGSRYLNSGNDWLAYFITNKLPYLDFWQTLDFYDEVDPLLDDTGRALLNCNDRYYLLLHTLHRVDVLHPWLFERCRELEDDPDGYLDLWARFHYKSTMGTFAGIIQEMLVDPEIKICILSCKDDVAKPFLKQIKQELEKNEDLKRIHSDCLWQEPRKEAEKWSEKDGITIKRHGNPKECTLEAYGLIDSMPTGRHFDLLDYDDLVTEKLVNNPEIIQKVTIAWELSDNLGTAKRTRKWHFGTRYSFADTYGVLIERGSIRERRYPATIDGTLKGAPVFLTQEKWEDIKTAQQKTVNAQMLLNPLAGTESSFRPSSLKHYDVIPGTLNVYIMVDPSKGRGARSDRTAIAVMGIDVGGNKYLLDGFCHRMKLSERYAKMVMLHKKWSVHPGVQMVKVGYEQYGMQSDLEVIEEYQRRDKYFFGIEELNSSKDGSGKNAKPDRISRLEPDFNKGRIYLPSVAYHPSFGGGIENSCLWDVWTEERHKLAADAGMQNNPAVDTIVFRPMQQYTRNQRAMEATMQTHRIVTAIKRRDERGDMYDLTRSFIEEMRLHPFAPHDDLIDAVSRVYDMEPTAPVMYETLSADPRAYPDS